MSEDVANNNELILASDVTFAPVVTLGQSEPPDIDGMKVHQRWVRTTVAGQWYKRGDPVDVSEKRLTNAAKNLKLALSRGVDVPISATHEYWHPRNTLGAVKDARMTSDGQLELLAHYYGEESLNVARRNKVSLGLGPLLDSHNNTYDDTITHMAVTPVPVLHGLPQGFVALSREPTAEIANGISDSVSALVGIIQDWKETQPPANAGKKGVIMFDDTTKASVTAYLGEDAGDDVNEGMRKVLAKAAPLATQVATLSRELGEAKATTLANEPAADPRIAKYVHATIKANVAEAVAKGEIKRHAGDLYLSMVAPDGKPDVTLLSREDDAGVLTLDQGLTLLKAGGAGLRGDERTPIQSVSLSRETPDGEPANDLAAIGDRQAKAMVDAKLANLPK